MKMNGQTRAFTRQVQVDLLALSDADLSFLIQQWIDGSALDEYEQGVPEETRNALGYTRCSSSSSTLADPEHLASSATFVAEDVPGTSGWLAPAPDQLRTLLTNMDVQQFALHVTTWAFRALHTSFPEWGEGATFNAHLANYLRRISSDRRALSNANHVPPGAQFLSEHGGRKYCPDCNTWRPSSEFAPSLTNADGLQLYCRVHAYQRQSERNGHSPE